MAVFPDGRSRTLYGVKADLLLLVFGNPDCHACKEHIPQCHASWINGYDPDFVIRTDLVYDVRAVPSLYLLSADKTVLLKDATTEQFFAAMGM